jgi:hypothetical protein
MKKRKKKSKRSKRSSTSSKKVSEMLGEYAKDFINMGNTIKEKRGHLSLAVFAWNVSLLTDEYRERMVNESIEKLKEDKPNMGEDVIEDMKNNIKQLVIEKERLFPNVKKIIVQADLQWEENGENYQIVTVSSDFPNVSFRR